MIDDVNLLSPADLIYAEAVASKLYDLEVDRRDKILASMTVVSGPITILIASVAFLANTTLDPSSDYMTTAPDIIVVVYYLVVLTLIWSVCLALLNFRRLLLGEFYSYLPDANALLNNFCDTKRYCDAVGMGGDGQVAGLMRINIVRLYASCASANRTANDHRLVYRQGVFRNTTRAVLMVAIGFVAVAIHRQQPHIWSPASTIGAAVHAVNRDTTGPAIPPAAAADPRHQ